MVKIPDGDESIQLGILINSDKNEGSRQHYSMTFVLNSVESNKNQYNEKDMNVATQPQFFKTATSFGS